MNRDSECKTQEVFHNAVNKSLTINIHKGHIRRYKYTLQTLK